jgi:ribonuclease PH
MIVRADGRRYNQLRPLHFVPSIYPYACGSVLFSIGNTRILCAVTRETGVPSFLRGKKKGWLTAEYALLPASTTTRSAREITAMKRQSRSVEISRLIGRALRSIVNLQEFGEHTITVDCDVLQADGGTRAASITAASLALQLAEKKWLASGVITKPIIRERVIGISAGLSSDSQHLLDLNAAEDNAVLADFNFVFSESGGIIEVQGCAEQSPITGKQMQELIMIAQQSVRDYFNALDMLTNQPSRVTAEYISTQV